MLNLEARIGDEPMEEAYLLTDEQKKLQSWARKLALTYFQADADRWEREGVFPWEHFKLLADHGILGLTLPRAYGGQQRPRIDAVLVQEQIARICFTTAEAAHLCMNGPAYAFSRIGSPRLQEQYLPDVVAGKRLLGIAITEEAAGSSVGEVRTRAEVGETSVIVDANTPGFSVERVFQKMGGNGIHEASLRFERCVVPVENILIPGCKSF